jgi:hypothetical protein
MKLRWILVFDAAIVNVPAFARRRSAGRVLAGHLAAGAFLVYRFK